MHILQNLYKICEAEAADCDTPVVAPEKCSQKSVHEHNHECVSQKCAYKTRTESRDSEFYDKKSQKSREVAEIYAKEYRHLQYYKNIEVELQWLGF